jgi:hypothetical protein
MSPTLALLVLTVLPAASELPNLDFSTGRLTHWTGEGFTVATNGGVTSADTGDRGRQGLLHRTFTLPAGAALIRFNAAAIRPAGIDADGALDVVLEAAGRQFIPKTVREADRWVKAPSLLPPLRGQPREHAWNVEKLAGRRVRIALVDSDARPGCHVVCSGFQVVTKDDVNAAAFAALVQKLERTHKLRRLSRYTSDHFFAYSNADEAYTEYRLDNCETIHTLFFKHFRKRGFAVVEPSEKLMVALFDTQAGFEAYMGRKMSSSVTGVYHAQSNRLVVYDFGTNRAFLEGKKAFEIEARRGWSDLDRERRIVRLGRYVRERRNDTNISTIMHEVAHQLSFNCGLLNRAGDVPLWLAEGLAVYCESTVGGAWQGIGEANPLRAAVLARQAKAKGTFLPLRSLVADDDWFRKAVLVDQVLLGYSQSWALFRLLIEEEPDRLKAYLVTIHDRRTPDRRLTDFAVAFGTDLTKLERRYQAYMRTIAKNEAK